MLARRRAKAGDPTLPRLPDTTARLVEFLLTVTDSQGHTRSITTATRPNRSPRPTPNAGKSKSPTTT
jgi:hypothetical protein